MIRDPKRAATYLAWFDMRRRCCDPRRHDFKYYGGRGITVCERWLSSFDAFVEDMGYRPDGLTLERQNNDGNYDPENCVWASRSAQVKNRRRLPRKSTRLGHFKEGAKGVSKLKRGRYRAYVYEPIEGGRRRQIHLGVFDSADAAYSAVTQASSAKAERIRNERAWRQSFYFTAGE